MSAALSPPMMDALRALLGAEPDLLVVGGDVAVQAMAAGARAMVVEPAIRADVAAGLATAGRRVVVFSIRGPSLSRARCPVRCW